LDKITVPWTCDSQGKFFTAVSKAIKYFVLYVFPILATYFFYESGAFNSVNGTGFYIMSMAFVLGLPWGCQAMYWYDDGTFPFKCKCENKK